MCKFVYQPSVFHFQVDNCFFSSETVVEDVAEDSLKRTNDRLHVCENSFSDEYVENTADLANTTEFLKDAITFKSHLMRQMED